jgi:hypothetical protein
VNRRALKLFVTPAPAKLRFASKSNPRAYEALVAYIERLIELGEQETAR